MGILVTGASGFLGSELVKRLLTSDNVPKVRVLIRGKDAQVKFKKLSSKLDYGTERLELVTGDISLDKLGLGDSEFGALAQKTNKIFHCAASTNLGQTLEEARSTNLSGTQHILDLALMSNEKKSFENLFHISTAYVAGDTTAAVDSSKICVTQPFKNGYEQAKAESEILVRNSGLNHCIYRPSIIVGDSTTGITTSFNVLYIPVKFLVRGFFSALPFNSQTPFDVVPVNYVADAITSLSGFDFRNPAGRIIHASHRQSNCYHLTVGIGRESSPWEIVEMVLQAFNRSKLARLGSLHIPALIPQEMLHLIHHSICVARTGVKSLEKLFTKKLGILSQIIPFLPYLIRNPQFDSYDTERDLHISVDRVPQFSTYAEKLFLYCMDSDWGRNPLVITG
jgi:thioester reductase-like protein